MSAGGDREARRQQALMAALLHDDAPAALGPGRRGADRGARGLRAYVGNAAATAARALGAAYPVVRQLVGERPFAALAVALWRREPPRRGDLASWGDALPAFIEASASLDAEPYLPDVARLEWALHVAAAAADVPPNLQAIDRLGDDDPAHLRLTLRPGTAVVASRHPIVAVWRAHLAERPGAGSAAAAAGTDRFAAARAALAAGAGETALVWRDGWRTAVDAMAPADADFTLDVLSGRTLGEALDAAAPAFDFAPWLQQALRQRWLVGVEPAGR